jgi:opacity protein-like surface antigen
MARLIQETIKKPLADEVLFGKLKNGGHVRVIATKDEDGADKLGFEYLDGPITPYVMGMIGYSFIDTNIPNGPTQGTCWWDPWYGYICNTWQPTFQDTAFAYGAAVGVRGELTEKFFIEGSYNLLWVDLDRAGNQSFDGVRLNAGWVF